MALADWARSDASRHRSYRNDVIIESTAILGTAEQFEALASDDDSVCDLTAACRQRASQWRRQLDPRYRMVVRAPFVVAGDVSTVEIGRYYEQVILPTADALGRLYTESKPNEPILVLLFAREEDYRRHTQRLFSNAGFSIYGYYEPAARTIGINLASGTGTLVHELTHALLDFDFPNMPLWLNEGIASLHEQAEIRGGERAKILGHINWRYPIVVDEIQAGRLQSIRELLASKDEFRGPQERVNYAHARYLCLYLQQRGQLVSLYEALRSDAENDPTGETTFLRQFADRSWSEIERDFQRWVIHLDSRVDANLN